jgi:hypothetical protein
MKVLGSSSGTYVVREKSGLKVYPMKSWQSMLLCKSKAEEGEETRVPVHGQTIQVFLYENKIATIAQGVGYILVDNRSQLVKGKVSSGLWCR